MKKMSLLIVVLFFGLLALTACGQAAAPAPAEEPVEEAPATEEAVVEEEAPAEEAAPTEEAAEAPAEDAPSIALVLIGPKDDHSWAEAAYNALEAEGADGAETAFSESVGDADVARVMREYVDQGFDMIVAHSFSYQDAVFEVAAENPEVGFAWAGGIDGTSENVADYDQPFYEPAYLVGILAGYISESGSLGALYGFDIPACHSMGEAMLAGAQTVNPDATLTVTAVGDWGDVSAAKEAGLAQVDTAGVDYWIGCGEGPTLGSIEAAKEAGGYATGYVGDMAELAPDVVLSSIVWDMGPIFSTMVDEIAGGSFTGTFYRFGIADGALDIAINPALTNQVPAEALTAIEAAKAAIQDGSLEVPFVPE
ncbi:MAG: BMP family protein [Anaerolineae bacterium]|nr:BMP family protein [Anaerolineae bacterium]